MGESYTPSLVRTVKAAGAFTKRRFIGFDKLQITAAGAAAMGVAQQDAALNELTPVTILGTAIVEAGGAVSLGVYVTSDAQGRAIAAANLAVAAGATAVTSTAANGSSILTGSVTPEKINGIAMEAASAPGDLIEVLLVK